MCSLPMHAVYMQVHTESTFPNSEQSSLLSAVFLPREAHLRLSLCFYGGMVM